MGLLLALMLAAKPTPCDELWTTVWKAYSDKELKKGRTPLFVKVPELKDRMARAWITECRTFDKDAISCAQGVMLEDQLKMLRSQLEEAGVASSEIAQMLQKARTSWTVLQCGEVAQALERAGATATREVLDAGVPRSDDCAGAELASGKCQCAHGQCMDICCPDGWACAHSGGTQAKCVKPR